MTEPVTIATALAEAERRLAAARIDAPRVQATALLAHVVKRSRAGLVADLRELLAPPDRERFMRLVERRATHHPLQYLLGRADFLDFEVRVGPGVFIPRPETEQLVEAALRAWDPDSTLAVDLCTGSGAVAIAMARSRPAARVLAIDVSTTALRSARASAADLGVVDRIAFVRGDLLQALASTGTPGVLVCNPPYAARGDVVQPEVRDHEPELAWAAGPAGTEMYARLVPEAARVLPPGCPMLLELGYDQSRTVPEILAADGRWTPPRIEPDFQGIARVLQTERL